MADDGDWKLTALAVWTATLAVHGIVTLATDEEAGRAQRDVFDRGALPQRCIDLRTSSSNEVPDQIHRRLTQALLRADERGLGERTESLRFGERGGGECVGGNDRVGGNAARASAGA